MGWKNLKEHYQIEHIVQVNQKGICIGSSYISELALINTETGAITKNTAFRDLFRENYPALLNASPSDLLELINTPDSFEKSLTVYTYDGGEILEKQCEAYGWPNVTHDGVLMYENKFFTDKLHAIDAAIENALARKSMMKDSIKQLNQELKEKNFLLELERANLDKLEAMLQQYNA